MKGFSTVIEIPLEAGMKIATKVSAARSAPQPLISPINEIPPLITKLVRMLGMCRRILLLRGRMGRRLVRMSVHNELEDYVETAWDEIRAMYGAEEELSWRMAATACALRRLNDTMEWRGLYP